MLWAGWLGLMIGLFLGHPLLVVAVLVLLWWSFDRAWVGRLHGPRRWLRERRDVARLRTRLSVNPSDRDARHGVAEWLVGRRRYDEALALVEQNVAAGDDDVDTLLLAGKAAFGASRAGAVDDAIAWLAAAREHASGLRRPMIDLELGRGLARHRRWDEARAPLEAMCEAQPGTVEGRVLLANVLAQLGDAEGSSRMRAEAWASYRAKPAFQRRRERPWAWKAKPSAALAYFAGVAVSIAAAVWIVVRVGSAFVDPYWGYEYGDLGYLDDFPDEDWNVDTSAPAPPPSRFERTDARREPTRRELLRERSDLNGNREIDLKRKLAGGDFVCRIPAEYGAPEDFFELEDEPGGEPLGLQWVFVDRETDADILVTAMPNTIVYIADAADLEIAEASLFAFEQMIEAQPLRDCAISFGPDGPIMGIRGGTPFLAP